MSRPVRRSPEGSDKSADESMQEFVRMLRALVREPSVVGIEDAFFRVLRRELEEYPVTVTRYLGLLVVQGEDPDACYFSAHVDRNGLLCTGPREFQYAAFIAGNRGELHGDSISEQFMETIAGRFIGQRVQAHAPYAGSYLGQGVITQSYICSRRRNLIFDVEGLDFLQPGTGVAFLDRLQESEDFLSAQLDNVLSVALLIELIRKGLRGTVLFTAGEECGRSWRYAAEWFQRQRVQTDRLFVLDTSPFATMEDVGDHELVLRRRDSTAEFDRSLTDELESRCERLGIKTIFKDEYIERLNRTREKPSSLGRTELGRLIAGTGGEVTGTTLQLPTTSYHTHQETVSRRSCVAALRMLRDLTAGDTEPRS